MENSELKSLVQRKHPEYDEKLCHWAFLNKTYESPREWLSENLFKFVREGEETYKGRLERAYRFNHTREVVDLVNKYLFKNLPERNPDVPAEVQRFRKRATLSGLSLEQFERQVARKASIYGRVYVVLDNNARPDQVVTKADEKRGDIRLYSYIVTPECMRDCGYDRDGNFNWVLIEEKARDDADPFDTDCAVYSKFRLWTKTHWYLFTTRNEQSKDSMVVEIEDQGEHGLGVVPVIKCDHIESDNKYAVPALIEDIAYLDRTVANYCSNLDQIINDQTFSQLVIPAAGLLSGISSTINTVDSNDPDVLKKTKDIIALGTSQVLLYDGENGSAPQYIAPDPKQAEIIITAIKQIINEIYHTVGLSGERTKQDNSMGIDNSSGVAKAFDFERVNALLSAKAMSMQAFSNRLENMVRIWHGEDPYDIDDTEVNVEYSTNFDVRSLNDELAIANQLSLLSVPMELRQYQMKDIVDKLYPMLEDAERTKIMKAIDGWEDALALNAQMLGGPSKPGDKSVDKEDPMGKNTTQGFPGKTPKAA
ncbi:portal protein [Xanthomonas phage JGB6]|nr:portal protein [Xanthomonas phage JGB6]